MSIPTGDELLDQMAETRDILLAALESGDPRPTSGDWTKFGRSR